MADLSSTYFYFNALKQSQVAGSEYALLLLLSTKSSNPHIVSLATPVYNSSISAEWTTVSEVPLLKAAASLYFYVARDKSEPNPEPCCVSDLVRLMVEGAVDGSTMICEVGGQEWTEIDSAPDLKQVLDRMVPKGPRTTAEVSTYNESDMVYQGEQQSTSQTGQPATSAECDLEALLESTSEVANTDGAGDKDGGDDNSDGEPDSYDSDNGTTYVKVNGVWTDEDRLPPQVRAKLRKEMKKNKRVRSAIQPDQKDDQQRPNRKKAKKTSFNAKASKKWIYVTGLPQDATVEEVAAHFSKAGILSLDPVTQEPRVKLYKTQDGLAKGDASVCFANEASVSLAIDIFDEGVFRGGDKLSVSKASFQQKGELNKDKVATVTAKQRKVAELAAKQAMSWDDGSNGRIEGGMKGLTIVVLKGCFTVDEVNDVVMEEVEAEVHKHCGGTIEKITVFSRNRDGVVVVKFKEIEAANACVEEMNGFEGWRGGILGRKLRCMFWDGVTDYTVKINDDEEEKRHEEFGEWLDKQEEELPEELRERAD